MLTAQKPTNEEYRLQTLLQYKVLDTAPSIEYDDITLLASAICQSPIALVSLIDSDRQWFKSKRGLSAEQTPRDISFCGHAILGTEVFVVNDASKDERFCDNPLVVSGPCIRFYAGAPLLAPNGMALGTLCVIDDKPRVLTKEQTQALEALARQVISQLELTKAHRDLSEKMIELQQTSTVVESQRGRLSQTSHLASLGVMAAGVAHEINNPLAVVVGNATILQRMITEMPDKNEELKIFAASIINASFRVTKIVQTLRDLAGNVRRDTIQLMDLPGVVQEAASLQSEKFKARNISLDIKAEENQTVHGNKSHLLQVLYALLSNAFDAVSELDERWVAINVVTKQKTFEVSVSDSGPGIEADLQSKIFQPFFTTKAPGKGMGLGLSTAHNLVEEMKGRLSLDVTKEHTPS